LPLDFLNYDTTSNLILPRHSLKGKLFLSETEGARLSAMEPVKPTPSPTQQPDNLFSVPHGCAFLVLFEQVSSERPLSRKKVSMDVPQFIAGRFRIECEIGTGGMGTVYRATHLGLERPVAVKIIKPEFAADRDVADRFLREARTMAKLRHAHAAMILDAGKLPDGRHFIIMEFVEGVTLSEALAREGAFKPERAVKIALQICEVLEEAHELGIIHRDLKPSNVMLNERGVMVLDFGVAKVLASSTEVTATHASTGSGQIVGTPRYMSPEQCLGQRVGARSDLYSLGVLLYEMLAGRPPFIDALPSAVLVKQATAAPPPLFQLCKNVPRPLALAVHSLLAKRPDDRPRTAAVARAMLAKSLTRPDRDVPEVYPLAATVASVGARANLVLRAAAPIGIVLAFGALLLVWANIGETAPGRAAVGHAGKVAQAAVGVTAPVGERADEAKTQDTTTPQTPKPQTVAGLSAVTPRQVISTLVPGTISSMHLVQTKSGLAMVALSEGRKTGTTHFFALEKRGDAYRVSNRGQLDTTDFRRAYWTSEKVDVDQDGYDEVLFTGTRAESLSGYRLVLYVPKTHKTYFLMVETKGRRPLRALWSANLLKANQTRYRDLLRQRVNGMLAKAKAK
jgi:predicted Ser/Thr protein kinase